jgi:phage terminase large subunit
LIRLAILSLAVIFMTPTEKYIAAAKAAGCPRDQVANFVRAGLILQPRQLLFAAAARQCDRPDGPTKVGFGGARGGGKSFVGLSQVSADDCQRYPGSKWLYLRKVGKTGAEAIQDLRRQVLHSIPHDFHVQKSRITFRNGSLVILGHFQNEKDVDNYLGLEYDGVLVEEATQLSARKVKDIGTCVRTSKPGWRPRQYFTTNPGNIGHAWFKAMFIVPLRAGAEVDTRFVQSTVHDNRFVNPEYRATLEALTGWQRKAWLDGDWDLAAGQFFTNWRRDVHVAGAFEVPSHWRHWAGFDYGFSHYTACYPMGLDGDGNLFVYDEHAEQGWLPEQHAAGIRSMLARHGLRQDAGIREHGRDDLEAIVAGLDCFNRDRRGKSTAEDYEALGLTLSRADVDRINGAAEILRRLGAPDGVPPRPPKLFISERCERLIECLPSLQRDPNRGEDVLKVDTDDDGLGGDDFYDALRYGAMYASVGPTVWGPNPLAGRR